MQERLVAMVVTISASAAITLMDLLLSRYIQFLFFIFSKTLLFFDVFTLTVSMEKSIYLQLVTDRLIFTWKLLE